MTPQIERAFLFVFRIFLGWLFFSTLSDEILNPRFVATHVVPVVNEPGIFHSFFSMLANPKIAPVIGFFVMYGQLLIGLSLLFGFMVRVSASVAITLMMLYWLVWVKLPPDLHVVGHASAVIPLVIAYRIVFYVGGTLFDIHILYSVILAYLIVGRAGHVGGLDAFAVRIPFLARLRVFD